MKGQDGLTTNNSPYNAQAFMIRQMLNQVNTAEPVQVTSCSVQDELAPVGTVTVKPMVNLVDGDGKGHEQSSLFSLPYLRMQGGENAFVVDPKPGDMGLAVYAMRDTEALKETKGQGGSVNPGSARTYSKGDGFFLGGFLNAVPKRYVHISANGIKIDDGGGGTLEMKEGKLVINAPNGIEMTAPSEIHNTGALTMGGDGATATMNANMQINGSVTSTGDQVAGGISQTSHVHGGVQTGGGTTGGPQ